MTEDNFFDNVYKNARKQDNLEMIPWARLGPNIYLSDFLHKNNTIKGKALVIGCGLGDDANALAKAGYRVDAIDISGTAIAMAKERFSNTAIDFRVEDIFRLPDYMLAYYDLVFESRTIQSIDPKFRVELVKIIANLLKEGGELLVHTNIQDDHENFGGPPWPLYRGELDQFKEYGLKVCYNKENQKNVNMALYDVISLFKKKATDARLNSNT